MSALLAALAIQFADLTNPLPTQQTLSTSGCALGWRGMGEAPRDGTPIEVRNDFGIAPTYSLDIWTTKIPNSEGTYTATFDKPVWLTIAPKEMAHTYAQDEHALCWRPYTGTVAAYVDPTRGAQLTGAYWRAAIRRHRP